MWFALLMSLLSYPPTPGSSWARGMIFDSQNQAKGATFFPNTRSWQIVDALDELQSPTSTPLARRVAVMRLEAMGFSKSDILEGKIHPIATGTHEGTKWLDRSNLRWRTTADALKAIPTPLEAWRSMGTGLSTTLREVNRDVAMNVRLFQELRGPARVEIARRLSHARPFASAAFPDLVRALNDPDTDVRDAAEVALFDGSGSLPAELYLPLLSDSDPDLRQGALRILLHFAPTDPRFIEFEHAGRSRDSLLTDLRSDAPERRMQGATYLANEELVPKRVATALIQAVRTGDFIARQGLVLGIERAWADGAEVEISLRSIQEEDPDPTHRTYAGAARRAIASNKAD